MKKNNLKTVTLIILIFAFTHFSRAVKESKAEELKVIENSAQESAQQQPKEQIIDLSLAKAQTATSYIDPLKYTLGPDDVVDITIMRHPEFSGTYPINLEGKIQYKFVGDLEVRGLTKLQLEDKLKSMISAYVINPEVNVTILEYRSKIIYVLGEVGQPGKYYMRSETIPVREAVVQAGLPTLSAAMRRCRLITPSDKGRVKTRSVDLYSMLYGGDLRLNLEMHPGDVLYVPATVMAKVIRVINPVSTAVGITASGPNDAKNAATTLAK